MLHIGINGRSIFRRLTGVQRYTLEITQALLALPDQDVAYSVFAGREAGSREDAGIPVNASFFPADGPVKGMIWEQALLKRIAKKASIDLLFNPANVAPLNLPVPSVVTIHDLAFLLFPEYFSRGFSLYYRSLIPRIARQAAAIITDSESSRAGLVERLGLPEEKITAIPLGVSPAFRQRPSKGEMEAVRRRYRLPEKYFLSLASLEPRKNLRGIIAAYRLLPAETTEQYKLVAAGAGNKIFADQGLSREMANTKPGQVVTTGYVASEDLPALYRMATALVFPSYYEGFGLPLLEAMAASTPVISSNRSSLPEVAGHAAVLVDPDSVEELAAAMELVAEDSGTRTLLIERGKKRAAGFTWEKTAEKTLKVLRGVV